MYILLFLKWFSKLPSALLECKHLDYAAGWKIASGKTAPRHFHTIVMQNSCMNFQTCNTTNLGTLITG